MSEDFPTCETCVHDESNSPDACDECISARYAPRLPGYSPLQTSGAAALAWSIRRPTSFI